MRPMRHRVVHPDYVVDSSPAQHCAAPAPQDLAQWYAVLRRPPHTWSVPEVAVWAAIEEEHGGAELPWLADRLQESCIDGDLLLQLTPPQIRQTLLLGRETADLDVVLGAIAELKHLSGGIASGQVLVPMQLTPPPSVTPTTRELLLTGQRPPRRNRKLPWDKDGVARAVDLSPARNPQRIDPSNAPDPPNDAPNPQTALPAAPTPTSPGRQQRVTTRDLRSRVLLSTQEAMLLQARQQAFPAGQPPDDEAQPWTRVDHEQVVKSGAQVLAKMKAEHTALARQYKLSYDGAAIMRSARAQDILHRLAEEAHQHHQGQQPAVSVQAAPATIMGEAVQPEVVAVGGDGSSPELSRVLGMAPGVSARTAALIARAQLAQTGVEQPGVASSTADGEAARQADDPVTLHAAPQQASPGLGQRRTGLRPARPCLHALPPVAHEELSFPAGKYRDKAWQVPVPDVYGTRDMERVKQVLAQGRSAKVHHTLKSQLSEDLVRHAHGLEPRQPGLQESSVTAQHHSVAEREMALRQAGGLPVSHDLYMATLDRGPWTRETVQRKTSPRHQPGTVTAPTNSTAPNTSTGRHTPRDSPVPCATHNSQRRQGGHLASPSAAADGQRRLSSPPQPAEHTHSSATPPASQQLPTESSTSQPGPSHATPTTPTRAVRTRLSFHTHSTPASPHHTASATPCPAEQTLAARTTQQGPGTRVINMVPQRLTTRPVSAPVGRDLVPLYLFSKAGHTLVHRGPRKPWSTQVDDTPYPLTGHPPTVAGGPMTKARAQVLAVRAVGGERGVTAAHRAAQQGMPLANGLLNKARRRGDPKSPGTYTQSGTTATAGVKHVLSGSPECAGMDSGRVQGWEPVSQAGETPLHRAARAQQDPTSKVVQHTLRLGADVNRQDQRGLTPLGSLLTQGRWCTDSQTRAGSSWPALADTGDRGHEGPLIMEAMLQSGADPNITDVHGNNALHQALQSLFSIRTATSCGPGAAHPRTQSSLAPGSGLPEVLEALCRRGADPHAHNRCGYTPLHLLVMQLHRCCRGGGQLQRALSVLLRHGVNPNAQDIQGRTALHMLLADVVEAALLEAANKVNHFHRTTSRVVKRPTDLLWAVRMLLVHQADVSMQDSGGQTPLHMAALAGAWHMLHLMGECSPERALAALDVRDNLGRTPLDCAEERGHDDVVTLLTQPADSIGQGTSPPGPTLPPAATTPPPAPPPQYPQGTAHAATTQQPPAAPATTSTDPTLTTGSPALKAGAPATTSGTKPETAASAPSIHASTHPETATPAFLQTQSPPSPQPGAVTGTSSSASVQQGQQASARSMETAVQPATAESHKQQSSSSVQASPITVHGQPPSGAPSSPASPAVSPMRPAGVSRTAAGGSPTAAGGSHTAAGGSHTAASPVSTGPTPASTKPASTPSTAPQPPITATTASMQAQATESTPSQSPTAVPGPIPTTTVSPPSPPTRISETRDQSPRHQLSKWGESAHSTPAKSETSSVMPGSPTDSVLMARIQLPDSPATPAAATTPPTSLPPTPLHTGAAVAAAASPSSSLQSPVQPAAAALGSQQPGALGGPRGGRAQLAQQELHRLRQLRPELMTDGESDPGSDEEENDDSDDDLGLASLARNHEYLAGLESDDEADE